jgi:hypothetical protein
MNGIMCFYIINAYNVEIKKYLKKIKDKSEIFYNLLIHEKSKIQHEFIINELNNQLKA